MLKYPPQATVGQAQTSTFKLQTATQDGRSSVTAGHPLKRDRVWGSVTINSHARANRTFHMILKARPQKKRHWGLPRDPAVHPQNGTALGHPKGLGHDQFACACKQNAGTPPCTHKTERLQQTYHKPTALGSPEGPRREQHDLNCKNCRDQCRGIHKLSLKLGWFT